MAGRKAIVIIGGGVGGHSTATALSNALDPNAFTIQLVTQRPFFIHYPAMVRTVVTAEDHLERRVFTPYDKLFAPGKAGEVVIGTAESISDSEVTLDDGRKLRYDWLVLASGTKWEGPLDIPFTESEAGAWLDAWRSKISEARDIVIGGGGAIGIEMSGEIKHFYPNTNVTLVQSAQALLNDTYPMKFRTYTLNALQGVGVNVILDDKVDIPQEPYSSVTTHKGKTLKADLVIPTRGGRLNTDFIRSLDPSIVTERGTVKVLSTLQVPLSNGKTNVFAIGDIIEWKEQKQVAKISTHSSVLIANLLSAIKGSKGTKEYKGFMEGIAMPFGPDKGVGYVPLLWGITLGNWATKTLKGKGLFIDLTRKSLNY